MSKRENSRNYRDRHRALGLCTCCSRKAEKSRCKECARRRAENRQLDRAVRMVVLESAHAEADAQRRALLEE